MAAKTSRGQQTRAKLIAAALECFREHGVQGASMDLIAATAGVTKPTAYAHFDSKKQLFVAVVSDLKVKQKQISLPEYRPGSDVTEQLITLFSNYLDVQLHPGAIQLYRAIVVEMARQNIEPPADADALPNNPLQSWLVAAADEGALRIEDVQATAMNLWAIVKGRFLWPALLGYQQASISERNSELTRAVEAAISPLLPPQN